MQQGLVLLVPHTELLQEQMSVPDDLLHLHVMLKTAGVGWGGGGGVVLTQ